MVLISSPFSLLSLITDSSVRTLLDPGPLFFAWVWWLWLWWESGPRSGFAGHHLSRREPKDKAEFLTLLYPMSAIPTAGGSAQTWWDACCPHPLEQSLLLLGPTFPKRLFFHDCVLIRPWRRRGLNCFLLFREIRLQINPSPGVVLSVTENCFLPMIHFQVTMQLPNTGLGCLNQLEEKQLQGVPLHSTLQVDHGSKLRELSSAWQNQAAKQHTI